MIFVKALVVFRIQRDRDTYLIDCVTGCVKKRAITSSLTRQKEQQASVIIEKSERNDSWGSENDFMEINLDEWGNDGDGSTSNGHKRNDGNDGNENTSKRDGTVPCNKENDRNRNDENCEGDSSETSGSINDLSTNEGWMQPLNQLSSIPINCRYCEKTFIRPANLARHEKNNCLKNMIAKCYTETNANPFVCTECGARFKHKKALNYHVRHMCQRSVKCNICHKNLIGTVVSARHLRTCAQKHAKKTERINDNEDQEDLLNSDSFVISEISDND